MIPFQFNSRTAVYVGSGSSAEVGHIVAAKSKTKKSIIVSDPFLVSSGLIKQIENSLLQSGFEVLVYDRVQSNPKMTEIDEVAQLIRETNSDLIVGVGGGSPLDVAKTSGMVASGDKSVAHYALGAHPFPEKKVTVVGIPTTAGTGAEVTSTVVFSDEKNHKLWGWDEVMAPEIAILDPTLTLKLPPHLTAATGLDAIVHAIEAASGKKSNPFIQGIALHAIRLLSKSLPTVLNEPESIKAREDLLVGASLAGLAIEYGGTGLAHNIGHALSSLADLHHGRAVSIALYHIYNYNLSSDQTAIFADVARALGANGEFPSDQALAEEGARLFRTLVEMVPVTLKIELEGIGSDELSSQLLDRTLSVENRPMKENNCIVPNDNEMKTLVKQIVDY